MNTPETSVFTAKKQQNNNSNYLILAVSSLISLVLTFFLAASDFEFYVKASVFGGIVFVYLTVCAAILIFEKKSALILSAEENFPASPGIFSPEIENRLFALEEANEFFGASLKPADMFRLVASRANELIPFASCALLIADKAGETLKIEFADGKNASELKYIKLNAIEGNAGKTFYSREAQFDEQLLLEKSAFAPGVLKDLNAAIAVPLFRGAEVFGVLQLYGDSEKRFNENSLFLLKAVGERAAPLFLSAFACEKNISNALTDSLTNLPNERAFFLVLENQIAESQRSGERRPLTIMTIDLKGFTKHNQKYGHATGDRLLKFAGEIVKAQLRQMDFMARAGSDEFLVILPTANEKIAREIILRIERTFVTNPFVIAADEKIFLQLNFGTAMFGDDGETSEQLLRSAQIKKQQAKSAEPSKILWFPKEFIN